ncbi:hypothetical protein chiPu_0032604, partial [Chiloscyllium punctatum]|nr:hypothetical protein [Chiloscyllium punctatum]
SPRKGFAFVAGGASLAAQLRRWASLEGCAATSRAVDPSRRRCAAPLGDGEKQCGVCGRLGLLPQLEQRVEHIGLEAGAAGVEMGEDLLAHPRVPELPDVLGNALHGTVVALAVEELSDLVRHIDQFVRRRRHKRTPCRALRL